MAKPKNDATADFYAILETAQKEVKQMPTILGVIVMLAPVAFFGIYWAVSTATNGRVALHHAPVLVYVPSLVFLAAGLAYWRYRTVLRNVEYLKSAACRKGGRVLWVYPQVTLSSHMGTTIANMSAHVFFDNGERMKIPNAEVETLYLENKLPDWEFMKKMRHVFPDALQGYHSELIGVFRKDRAAFDSPEKMEQILSRPSDDRLRSSPMQAYACGTIFLVIIGFFVCGVAGDWLYDQLNKEKAARPAIVCLVEP
jgi:hypothetical protein